MEQAQGVTPHSAFAQTLSAVVNGGKDGVASKSEDGSVGMDRPKSTEGKQRRDIWLQTAEQVRQNEQQCDKHARESSDKPPNDGSRHKHPNNTIVITKRFHDRGLRSVGSLSSRVPVRGSY